MFQAGQVLTADDLNAIPRSEIRIVRQGIHQDVVGTTSLVDTRIVIPVNGLTIIRFRGRYISRAGGIRWAWRVSAGAVNGVRNLWGPGHNTEGVVGAATTYMHRSIANLTFAMETNHFSGGSTNAFAEDLTVDGTGELTLQVAQQSSIAAATTFRGGSWAEYFGTTEPESAE